MNTAIISALSVFADATVYFPVVDSIALRTLYNPDVFEYSPYGEKTYVMEVVGGKAGDYNPNVGWEANGSGASAVFKEHIADNDRAISFKSDWMANVNAINQGQVLPIIKIFKQTIKNFGAEIDAVTFSGIRGFVKEDNVIRGDQFSVENAFNTILDIETQAFNNEITDEVFVFVSPQAEANIKKALVNNNLAANPTVFTFEVATGLEVKLQSIVYNNLKIVRVPENRFYDFIVVFDAKTPGQESGGYAPTVDAEVMQALVVPKEAAAVSFRHFIANVAVPQAAMSGANLALEMVNQELASNLNNQVTVQNIGVNQLADAFSINTRTVYGVETFEVKNHTLYAYYAPTPVVEEGAGA